MTDDPPTTGIAAQNSRGLAGYILWSLVAVMVYVLGSGPLLALEKRALINYDCSKASPRVVKAVRLGHAIYTPLFWAYWNTSLRKPIGVYWHVWFPECYGSS
jgi:hypothetical protein